MRYKRLDLNLLPALRALLTEKNVTRAAEVIHVTQPAMSGILSRLRDYFEDPLVVSVGRKMELTPLAESLVFGVNDVLLRIDATLASEPAFDPVTSRRHFSIVASDYVTSVLLVDVLRDMATHAPGISIELCQPSATASEDLEAGEVDFVITPERFTLESQSSTVLFSDTYHAIVDQNHPDIGDSVSLEQYLEQGHAIFQNNGKPLFEFWFEKEHGPGRRVEASMHNFSLLAPLVMGTKRIATLHTRLAMRMAELLPVRMVRLEFATPPFVEMLQWHKYRDQDLGSLWLREQILNRARLLPPIHDR